MFSFEGKPLPLTTLYISVDDITLPLEFRELLYLLAAFPPVYWAVWLAEPCNPTCSLGCYPSGNPPSLNPSGPPAHRPTLRPQPAISSNSPQRVNGIFCAHRQVFFYEGSWRDWVGKSWSHLCAQYNMKNRRERNGKEGGRFTGLFSHLQLLRGKLDRSSCVITMGRLSWYTVTHARTICKFDSN